MKRRLTIAGPAAVAAVFLLSAARSVAAVYPDQPASGAGLLCLSDSGVICFDRQSMTRRWKTLKGSYSFGPVVTPNRLVVGSSIGLHALKTADGAPAWGWNEGRGVASPVVDGNEVYAAGHQGRVASLALDDGAVSWQRRLGGDLYTPLLLGDWLITCNHSGEIVALDRDSGETVWTRSLHEPPMDRPVAVGKVGFVVTTFDGTIEMVSPGGQPLWREEDVVPSFRAVVAGDLLIFGGADGKLRARNPVTGAVRWTIALSGQLSIPARASHGEVAVVGPGGEIAVAAAGDGTVLKRASLPGSPLGGPIPLEDDGWRFFYRDSGEAAWQDVRPEPTG